MAVLKDLIVHGRSRFINGAQFNTINAESIGATAGIFDKLIATTLDAKTATIDDLTAKNATVTALLDVQGDMHTNSWSNSNIATIDGSFYITPTSVSSDGSNIDANDYTPTGTITYASSNFTKISITGTFDTSQLTLNDNAHVAWPANSEVIVTGDVLVGTEWLPLGTIRGKLESQVAATNASKTISVIPLSTTLTDGQGHMPVTLEAIRIGINLSSGTSTALKMRKVKVSLTSRASGSTQYPVGILLSAQSTGTGQTFIDIYGGNNARNGQSGTINGSTKTFTKPMVRLGNLEGLPSLAGQTPSGWGIYTSNGFFEGAIVAKEGYIGNGNAAWTIGNDANSGAAYIYTGTQGSNSSAYLSTGYGTVSIADSGTLSGTKWAYTAGANFGVTTNGTLYAKGAQISGNVAATQGFTVTSAATNGVTLASMTGSGITLGQTTSNKFNILITDSAVSGKGPGILLRQGTNVLNEIGASGIKLYLPGDQTNAIAQFGETSYIGKHDASRSYIKMDYHSLQMVDKEENSFFEVTDLRTNNGFAPITDTFIGDGQTKTFTASLGWGSDLLTVKKDNQIVDASEYTKTSITVTFNTAPALNSVITLIYNSNSTLAKCFTFGSRATNSIIGPYSFATGISVTASGYIAHTEGIETIASGQYAHAEGDNSKAEGQCAHAEGQETQADKACCHAEGLRTIATGLYAHAEGQETQATGLSSHAEGYSTVAAGGTAYSGAGAHAEGAYSQAHGVASHAQNYYTVATEYYQTVIGKYNKATVSGAGTTANPYTYTNVGNYAFIIGNGTANTTAGRSNALTVDWGGNTIQAGRSTTSDMTSSEIQDFIDDLQVVGNGVVIDYIVDQGTSDIWTYRKWASGVAECWGHQDIPSTTYSANGGYRAISAGLPSGLFITSPDIVIASGRITGNVQTMMGFTSPNDANSIQTYLINRNTSATTQTGVVYWNVKGRWK